MADRGHPIEDPYVEHHWLPVLGPSATWLLRRLARELSETEDADIDLADAARSLGMAHEPGRDGPFARAFGRLVMFGLAVPSPVRTDHLFVRCIAPDVPRRHSERLAARTAT